VDCFDGKVPGITRAAGQALLTREDFMALPEHSVSHGYVVFCGWPAFKSTLLYRYYSMDLWTLNIALQMISFAAVIRRVLTKSWGGLNIRDMISRDH
jgi:hypothetical protein